MGSVRLALRSLTTNILRATDGRDVLHNSPDGWEVEQPWLWWTGPAGGSGLGPFGNPIPGAGAGHQYSGISAVSRATALIVDTLAALPWRVYRNEVERLTTPDWLSDPQALRLDGRVIGGSVDDVRLSHVDFWGEWIRSALWYGDGFVYVPVRNADGSPRPPLWLLNPADVAVRDGAYFVGDEQLGGSEIIHLRQGPIVNGRGTGVFERFAAELGVALALRDYTAGAFVAGVPAGYLKTTTANINQKQADELKQRWMAQHGGRRSIAVLNATTEFHPLTWSPVDLAATDFAGITLGQIANMFNVPAYMLGAPTDSNTYANVEARMLELYQLTLLAWVKRIESVLDAQLPRGTEMNIYIDGLLRADFATRVAGYKTLVELGVMTIDEVRRIEGMPPLAEGVVA